MKQVARNIARAFTLIELLVVIAIIALLLSVLMPALSAVKDVGKRIVCSSNIRTMGMANTLYANEEDGWYVPIIDRTTTGTTRTWPSNMTFRKLMGYSDMQNSSDGNWHAPKEFLCPSDVISNKRIQDTQWTSWLSYGYNLTDWYFANWNAIVYAGHKAINVPNPSGEIFFTESHDWWLWWKGADYTVGWDVLGQDTITPYKNVGCDGPTLYRHNDGANLTFYDGHVEYQKKDKVWSKEAWDTGRAGMWSTFKQYPPTKAQQDALPVP
jgi:prepilin-type N-terminal cleavage/methylation domain-containing protein/prepilin-type processing-associated H-X9-DG protein